MVICPKCGRELDGRGYNTHLAACKGNRNGVSPLQRYQDLQAQIKQIESELAEEKRKLIDAADQIDKILAGKQEFPPAT